MKSDNNNSANKKSSNNTNTKQDYKLKHYNYNSFNSKSWVVFSLFGFLLTILGVVCIVYAVISTILSVIVFGVILIVRSLLTFGKILLHHKCCSKSEKNRNNNNDVNKNNKNSKSNKNKNDDDESDSSDSDDANDNKGKSNSKSNSKNNTNKNKNQRWGMYRWDKTNEALKILGSFITLIIGIFIVTHPLVSEVGLTLLIALYLIIDGFIQIFLGMLKHMHGWGWIIFGGIVSFILGILILIAWPIDSLVLIGVFTGINISFYGLCLFILGCTFPIISRESRSKRFNRSARGKHQQMDSVV